MPYFYSWIDWNVMFIFHRILTMYYSVCYHIKLRSTWTCNYKVISWDLCAHDWLYTTEWTIMPRTTNPIFIVLFLLFNMICGLSMTHSHTSKITKWLHIFFVPLVGSPKPRTKSKNSPTHPGTEKREAKVVILGDFRGGLRVLFHRFQTWACGYEEI